MYTPADSFYFSNGTNITARRLSKPGAVTLVGAVATVGLQYAAGVYCRDVCAILMTQKSHVFYHDVVRCH